ncbi:MAG: hypothetical protein FWD68_15410 [Alphaproteobacteria bacterium]|nr:hypothetical protein [Alphaproteobacteria bacterium]
MKVIELGRGLRGIVPEPDRLWADSIRSLNRRRLKRAGVSDEDIEKFVDYAKRVLGFDPDKMDGD